MKEATSLAKSVTRLSWSEVCAAFPDEWVVLVDADWIDDHNFEFARGYLRIASTAAKPQQTWSRLRCSRERGLLLHGTNSRTGASVRRLVKVTRFDPTADLTIVPGGSGTHVPLHFTCELRIREGRIVVDRAQPEG